MPPYRGTNSSKKSIFCTTLIKRFIGAKEWLGSLGNAKYLSRGEFRQGLIVHRDSTCVIPFRTDLHLSRTGTVKCSLDKPIQ